MSNEKENKKTPENQNEEQNREISIEEASEVNGGGKFYRKELDFPFSEIIEKPIFKRTDF